MIYNITKASISDLNSIIYEGKDLSLLEYQLQNFKYDESSDFIEFSLFTSSKKKITGDILYDNFSILDDKIVINVEDHFRELSYNYGSYFISYSFFRKIGEGNNPILSDYVITEIDQTRTEIRIESISDGDNSTKLDSFIEFRNDSPQFVDFFIDIDSNKFISNNIIKDGDSYILKLYKPLPVENGINSTLNVLLELSDKEIYKVEVLIDRTESEEIDNGIRLRSPNFNINANKISSDETGEMTLSDILDDNLINESNRVRSIIKNNKINIDYTDWKNFIHFSSSYKRFYNFINKLFLIQYITNDESEISQIIESFDGYEHFLYYHEDGFPKVNGENELIFGNVDETFISNVRDITDPDLYIISNVGDYILDTFDNSAIFDEENPNNLFWNIPEYLRESTENHQYRIFIEMIGHMFDDIWIYINKIQDLYNSDNRINTGINKEILIETLNNFGLNLYSGSYTSEDLYSSFLGVDYSKKYDMSGVYPNNTDKESIDDFIEVALGKEIPLNDIEYRIYKRLFNNLPILYKSKGTIAALETIIRIYGIPVDMITVKEYGAEIDVHVKDNAIPGNTLSNLKTLEQDESTSEERSRLNKYIEVGYSPSYQIDKDIDIDYPNFNLDEFIGDPRLFDNNYNYYTDLNELRKDYFTKYIDKYNVFSFIRLVKFINNSLFETLNNFIPSNTTASIGINIRQHKLERLKYVSTRVTLEDLQEETTVKTGLRDFKIHDENYPITDRRKGNSVQITGGGTGGSFEPFNDSRNHPNAKPTTNPEFNGNYQPTDEEIAYYENDTQHVNKELSQEHKLSTSTPVGLIEGVQNSQEEFYNGIFPNSSIDNKLDEICRVYFSNENLSNVKYNIRIKGLSLNGETEEYFTTNGITPENENILEIYIRDNSGPVYMKVPRYYFPEDIDLGNHLSRSGYISFMLRNIKILNSDPSQPPIQIINPHNCIFYYTGVVLVDGSYMMFVDLNKSTKLLGYIITDGSGENVSYDYSVEVNGKMVKKPTTYDPNIDQYKDTIYKHYDQNYFTKSNELQFVRGWYDKKYYDDLGNYINHDRFIQDTPFLKYEGSQKLNFKLGDEELDRDLYHSIFPPSNLPQVSLLRKSSLPFFAGGTGGIIEVEFDDFETINPSEYLNNSSGNSEITYLGVDFGLVPQPVNNVKITRIFGENVGYPLKLKKVVNGDQILYSYHDDGVDEKLIQDGEIFIFSMNTVGHYKFTIKLEVFYNDNAIQNDIEIELYDPTDPFGDHPESLELTLDPLSYPGYERFEVTAVIEEVNAPANFIEYEVKENNFNIRFKTPDGLPIEFDELRVQLDVGGIFDCPFPYQTYDGPYVSSFSLTGSIGDADLNDPLLTTTGGMYCILNPQGDYKSDPVSFNDVTINDGDTTTLTIIGGGSQYEDQFQGISGLLIHLSFIKNGNTLYSETLIKPFN